MVLTLEELINDSLNVPMTSTPVKKPSARKSLCLFTNKLNVKNTIENVMLELQNPNAEPCKWVIAYGPRKQNERVIQK